MPRKCCVPNCRGNYDTKEKVTVFRFPVDDERKKLWLSKIPRKDFVPSKDSVVCSKHFCDGFVIYTDSAVRPDGSVLTLERTIPKLAPDAYPSIFPDCPSYLSEEPPTKRKAPDERRSVVQQRDEAAFIQLLESDRISSFIDFCSKIDGHVEKSKFEWIIKHGDKSFCSLYCIKDSQVGRPTLISTILIHPDMHVEIFTESIGRVPNSALKWILGSSCPPTLQTWMQLDNLLSCYSTSSVSKGEDFKSNMETLIDAMHDLCTQEDRDDKGDALNFLIEQLRLQFSSAKRYSSETLLWAFQLFACSPKAYDFVRNSPLIIPHTSYLKRLSSVFSMNSGVAVENTHIQYLKEKCKNMEDYEKNVILMIDEIYVKNQISYKEGKLEGLAVNDFSQANTAQVFMISSVLSKKKDVISIVPVKSLNADLLFDLLMKVLQLLHAIGYIVVCVISDNNRVNRNAFAKICGGELTTHINHPWDPSQQLFFLFDTVHLFKSIRNNWLSQKDQECTFIFPKFENFNETTTASFAHLRKLYTEEQTSTIKLAPALTQKSVYPTNTEKQNVGLMLKVFNNMNVTALEHYEKQWHISTQGTRQFLSFFWQLWDIINVKRPFKDIRLRNENCAAVDSVTCRNVKVLESAVEFLQKWQGLKRKPREGVLSNETMTALEHTLRSFILLIKYLIVVKKFKYVLLGKFQTDNLEFRFGRYRQMSGCNYHVSIQQILENEKKLKLVSVLKLVSASKGSISLKDFCGAIEDIQVDSEEHAPFLHLLHACDESNLTQEQTKALVYISGYCVTKAALKINCKGCVSEFKRDTPLQVDTSEEYSLISALDRGGLTWPTEAATNLLCEAYKIFQMLIASKTTEQQFMHCRNHRSVLLKLITQRANDLAIFHGHCEICSEKFFSHVDKCIKPAVNIFINNYSKKMSDNKSTTNKRKLKTFSK